MEAIPMMGIESAMMLAAKVVSAQKDHPGERGAGVSLASGLSEALQSMVLTVSLVTYIQNVEDPCISLGGAGAEDQTPADILRAMADSWEATQESNWLEKVVQPFVETFNEVMIDREADGLIPKYFDVSDVLGEGK